MVAAPQTTPDSLPSRKHAGLFDLHLPDPAHDNKTSGSNPMYWTERWRDLATGEEYLVTCWDGSASGKLAHSWEDEALLEQFFRQITERCHREAAAGNVQVTISQREWLVMQDFTHSRWLESKPGANDGKQSRDGFEGGPVGMCHGIPVVCDLACKDDLLVPPKTFAEMSDDEFGAELRIIANTSTSEAEIRQRVAALGYTGTLSINSHLPEDSLGLSARAIVAGLGGPVMANGAMLQIMAWGHNGTVSI